ncbi:WD repeat-containing protein 35 [Pycnococcus provasolii]
MLAGRVEDEHAAVQGYGQRRNTNLNSNQPAQTNTNGVAELGIAAPPVVDLNWDSARPGAPTPDRAARIDSQEERGVGIDRPQLDRRFEDEPQASAQAPNLQGSPLRQPQVLQQQQQQPYARGPSMSGVPSHEAQVQRQPAYERGPNVPAEPPHAAAPVQPLGAPPRTAMQPFGAPPYAAAPVQPLGAPPHAAMQPLGAPPYAPAPMQPLGAPPYAPAPMQPLGGAPPYAAAPVQPLGGAPPYAPAPMQPLGAPPYAAAPMQPLGGAPPHAAAPVQPLGAPPYAAASVQPQPNVSGAPVVHETQLPQTLGTETHQQQQRNIGPEPTLTYTGPAPPLRAQQRNAHANNETLSTTAEDVFHAAAQAMTIEARRADSNTSRESGSANNVAPIGVTDHAQPSASSMTPTVPSAPQTEPAQFARDTMSATRPSQFASADADPSTVAVSQRGKTVKFGGEESPDHLQDGSKWKLIQNQVKRMGVEHRVKHGKADFGDLVMYNVLKARLTQEAEEKGLRPDPSLNDLQNKIEAALARQNLQRKLRDLRVENQKGSRKGMSRVAGVKEKEEEGEEDEDVEDEEMSEDRLKLLYLVSRYSKTSPDGEDDVYMRKTSLLVLIYEGIVEGIFGYDYAPATVLVGGRRVFMNITQEGNDDIDHLRSSGYLSALKLSSKKFAATIALRVTNVGKKYIEKHTTEEMREEVDNVVFLPDSERNPEDLLLVRWVSFHTEEDAHDKTPRNSTEDESPDENAGFSGGEKASPKGNGGDGDAGDGDEDGDDGEEEGHGKFQLWCEGDPNFTKDSTITEIENVSYVSSPYVPKVLRRWGRPVSDNSHQTSQLENAESNIKDELDETLTLNNVHLVMAEWIPMGANQIVSLNDKLGSLDRVQGGFFTSVIDDEPDAFDFRGQSEGLSEVDILDFDEMGYVNFEAEIHFPEEDGIIQVENFGCTINAEGFIGYGMRVDGLMEKVRDEVSLDNLSRMLVDVQLDTSKMLDNLLSPHQRSMLDIVYLNDAEGRDKYNAIMCERINPMELAEIYMDKGENENELKQVLGDTYNAWDLSDDEVVIMGQKGILLCSPKWQKFESIIVTYLSIMIRNLFMRSLFQRASILIDGLKTVREQIDNYESNPNSIGMIRNSLSEFSADIILLDEVQSYLFESLALIQIPEEPTDAGCRSLYKILHLQQSLGRLSRRISDQKKTIEGARGEVQALRNMADTVAETRQFRVTESSVSNTKNLEDVFRSNERASASLDIMQTVLAGSLAFDILDRLHGLYLSIAPDIKWANDSFRPIYNTPLAYFFLNMIWWGVIGGFIQWLMGYISDISSGVLSLRYKLNTKIDMVGLREYLASKNIEVEDIDSDKRNYIKKYTWDEAADDKWQGTPPKIEMTIDEKYAFILSVFIQVNTKTSKIRQREMNQLFFDELRDYDVIDSAIQGLEDCIVDTNLIFEEEEEKQELEKLDE